MKKTGLLLIVVLVSVPLAAQSWTTGTDGAMVRVENTEGYVFEVASSSARQALCTFRLPEGDADEFARDKLPGFSIDSFDRQRITPWPAPAEPPEDGGDFMEAARRTSGSAPLVGMERKEIRFLCWIGLSRQSSPTRGVLRQVMDGDELTISFTRGDGSSSETSFSLDGAGELIAATFGITERPTEQDILQDDLLRLRVHYRGSTCFLLAGKKNRNRCLDAVNSCAQKTHESLVAMLGCIEVD